jgi:hypothetical protein
MHNKEDKKTGKGELRFIVWGVGAREQPAYYNDRPTVYRVNHRTIRLFVRSKR